MFHVHTQHVPHASLESFRLHEARSICTHVKDHPGSPFPWESISDIHQQLNIFKEAGNPKHQWGMSLVICFNLSVVPSKPPLLWSAKEPLDLCVWGGWGGGGVFLTCFCKPMSAYLDINLPMNNCTYFQVRVRHDLGCILFSLLNLAFHFPPLWNCWSLGISPGALRTVSLNTHVCRNSDYWMNAQ